MYQVIIILDESREKSYYHSYVESEDKTIGNISCDELPPYQDLNKAQSCYWDAETTQWVFDEEKYEEIIAQIAAEKEEAEQEAAEAAATPTNAELAECAMELGEGQSNLEDAIAELGELYSELDLRLTALEGGEA